MPFLILILNFVWYNKIMDRYNHLNNYLKNRFGGRTLKICVDGHFSCPNRDGKVGVGGCIFCGEKGAGELIKGKCENLIISIKNQISTFLNSYRGERAERFIVYFQNFTNTYDACKNLKLRYDTAISVSDKIIGIDIATRPDAIDDEIIALLKSYTKKYYVCVELGLQTADDDIANKINRGYKTEKFIEVVKKLRDNNIDVVAHMMVGLPGETEKSILDTVDLINDCQCNGIKIHSTFILKNTKLEKMYLSNNYTPITLDYYTQMIGRIIGNLKKNIIVHRITGDPPKEYLVAPDWTARKKIVINSIEKYLKDNNIIQGCYLN